MISARAKARFWRKVDKGASLECWLWKGGITNSGYGNLWVETHMVLAHRISYELHYGSPDTMLVCHRCDVPRCVNPGHLFLGTDSDNSQDKVTKNRQRGAVGERNKHARLTCIDIPSIRAMYARGGVSQREIGKRFGVSDVTISYIISRKTWSHI